MVEGEELRGGTTAITYNIGIAITITISTNYLALSLNSN